MINKLNPNFLNCNIFNVYDYEGLTIQELLSQFFTKINECVDGVNNMGDLAQWLVNQGLNEEVAKQLNKWLLDGTLQDIINENLFNELKSKIDNQRYYVSVKEFNNDIQATLDYCKENNKTCFIPCGEYTINEALINNGVNVIGENATNTIIKLGKAVDNGMILKSNNSAVVKSIEGLTFICLENNMMDKCGIYFEVSPSNYSHSYKISNCHFERLGCAIETNDTFRSALREITINDCKRGIFIRNKTVQLSVTDVIANTSIESNLSSNRYRGANIGLQIGQVNDNDVPESIKLDKVCLVNFDVGIYQHFSLYTSINQCDIDLCRDNCIEVNSVEGVFTLTNSWLNLNSEYEKDIIKINLTTFDLRKIIIKNNSISGLGNGLKTGIKTTSNYIKGIELSSNNIYGVDKGIVLTSPRSAIIRDNTINATSYDIWANGIDSCIFDGNYTSKCYLHSDESRPYSVRNMFNTSITYEGICQPIKD